MNKNQLSLGALGIGLVLFGAVNLLSDSLFTSARLDVTEQKLYTLSDGAVEIARGLEEPVYLDFYFSEKQASKAPQLGTYAKRVRELLEEMELRSGGNLVLDVISPEPFSAEEDRAVAAGLIGARGEGLADPVYFGLVGTNTLDGEEVIPFFDPSNERLLEYDLIRLVYTLANPERNKVGVLSSLPLEGGPSENPFDPRGGTPPWQILPQLRNFFDVEILEAPMESIDPEIDVLLLAHAKGLTPETLYAIDQFVLGGGRVLAFVDPHCEADRPPTDPSNPMAAMTADRSSSLPGLLEAWGVTLAPDQIVGDRSNAMRVTTGGNQAQIVSFVAYLQLDNKAFAEDDPVISQLQNINMAMAGALEPIDGATTEFAPLIQTSDEAMHIEKSRVQFMADPADLLATYIPEGERLTLAARISGTVSSAFPDGPPTAGTGDEEGAESDTPEHLTTSTGPINVVLVSDADILEDRFWIGERRLGPMLLGYQKTADNGDFVINTIDNLCGSDALISISAGAQFVRPFERVEAIRLEAEERFLAESNALEQKLSAIDARLAELQREKGGNGSFILGPEELAEIRRSEEEKLETRKQLRDVQHNMDKDIERLGNRLKLGNIFGTPLVFILIVLAVWRARRR